jgi:hypothetical protein
MRLQLDLSEFTMKQPQHQSRHFKMETETTAQKEMGKPYLEVKPPLSEIQNTMKSSDRALNKARVLVHPTL